MSAFNDAKKLLNKLEKGEILLSPQGSDSPVFILDAIRAKLKEAGKSAADLTGGRDLADIAQKAHVTYAWKLYKNIRDHEIPDERLESVGATIEAALNKVGMDIPSLDPAKPAEQMLREYEDLVRSAEEYLTPA